MILKGKGKAEGSPQESTHRSREPHTVLCSLPAEDSEEGTLPLRVQAQLLKGKS